MLDKNRLPQRQKGLPDQSSLLDERAIVTDAYTVIPHSSQNDIVASRLPLWNDTFCWILARPVAGFCSTFSHYLVEMQAGGGSSKPDQDDGIEHVLFVMHGAATLSIDGHQQQLQRGGYAFIPAGMQWTVHNGGDEQCTFHWIRKRYEPVEGLEVPELLVCNANELEPQNMLGPDGGWTTAHFVDPADMRHDMAVTIVSFDAGVVLPFMETHVMEHGLYVLEGKGVYKLNQDWVEVQAGDYMWLRAFCPQACYAGGDGTFRYLLYKDVNRHMPLP